ncbi:MAG: TetR/AcrR family transcriptional repressor of uid operon [Granulosicoccus sp.]
MARKKDDNLHAKRRQQILEAAKQCFVTHGFHQSSMRLILKVSGISAGGAYNYFASKDDIVKGIVEEELADVDMLGHQLQSTKDPLIGIGQLVSDIIVYTTHENAVLASEIHAEACRNPEISKLTATVTKKLRHHIGDAISKGRDAGVITADYSVEELTGWVVALYEGYIGRIASDKKLKRKSGARMAEQSVLQFLGNDS